MVFPAGKCSSGTGSAFFASCPDHGRRHEDQGDHYTDGNENKGLSVLCLLQQF